jgi:hypothetical protein
MHHLASGRLLAHRPDTGRGRADPYAPTIRHRLGELGILGQKPVPRVDRIRPHPLRRLKDSVDPQIRIPCRGRPHFVRSIRHPHVGRSPIGLRVDRRGLDTSFLAGPENAHRDLTPIRHEDTLETANRTSRI